MDLPEHAPKPGEKPSTFAEIYETVSAPLSSMENSLDQQYKALLERTLTDGHPSGDRTGTGTQKVFGAQLRHDLQDGFPLLTTKKVWFEGVARELLWFLSGSTNIKPLVDEGVSIWTPNAYQEYVDTVPDDHRIPPASMEEFEEHIIEDEEFAERWGELGPIYGHNWRNFGSQPDCIPQPSPSLPADVEATYLGVGNGEGKEGHPVAKTWEGMMGRCYNPNWPNYEDYGARGVSVCDRWLEFRNFANDVDKLPGWAEKKESWDEYVLDKDKRGNGFVYGPDSCSWITQSENMRLKSDKIYKVEKDGEEYSFRNPTAFCREHGIDDRNFSDLWTGRKNAHKRYGFKLIGVEDTDQGVDQIQRLIDGLRESPDSRRHVVSAWNPPEIDDAAVPPCHTGFQVVTRTMDLDERRRVADSDGCPTHADLDDHYVPRRALSIRFTMRSTDVFLGLPFNIASYSLLAHLIAQQVNMVPETLIYQGTDVHLYQNHLEQAEEQLSRTGKQSLPELQLPESPPDTIFDYTFEDLGVTGYDHHPAITAPVAT